MANIDKKWEAEMDADTLAQAKVIEKDKPRLKRAEKAASRMAEEAQKRATAMKQVSSNKSTPRKSSGGGGSKPKPRSTPSNPLTKGIPK